MCIEITLVTAAILAAAEGDTLPPGFGLLLRRRRACVCAESLGHDAPLCAVGTRAAAVDRDVRAKGAGCNLQESA